MSVIFYGCVTMDGYLATKNHGLDWLYESGSPEETDYENFYKEIDITIMGKRTFEAVQNIENIAEIYGSTVNYVFTNDSDFKAKGFQRASGDINQFIKKLGQDKRIWIATEEALLWNLYLRKI